MIDHNLIFDPAFDKANFLGAHVFNSVLQPMQNDLFKKQVIEERLTKALFCWSQAWENIPEEWLELNEGYAFFNPDKHFKRLNEEANGGIWQKLL